MNASELALELTKSLLKKPTGARLESLVSAATRRELSAMRKLSQPLSEAEAAWFKVQRVRHQAWAPYL